MSTLNRNDLKTRKKRISKWLRDELETTTEVQIKIKKGSDKLLTDSFEGSLGSCTILESSRGLRTFSVSNSGFTKSPFLDRNTHRRHNNKRAVLSLFSTLTSFFLAGKGGSVLPGGCEKERASPSGGSGRVISSSPCV